MVCYIDLCINLFSWLISLTRWLLFLDIDLFFVSHNTVG